MIGAMKRIAPPLHTVLFATFPLLSLFALNQSELELSVLWWPLVLCVVASVALYAVILLFTKLPAKAGGLASAIVLGVLYFELFSDAPLYTVALLLLVAIAFFAILRTKSDLNRLTIIAGVVAAAMALPQAASIVLYHANHRSLSATDPRLWPTALRRPVVAPGSRRPDIYMIIPDDYARMDVLKKYFHYDDGPFINQLKKRGFVISDQIRSPYADSESNIAATLNMDYLTRFARVLGETSEDVRPVKKVMQNNRASRLLRSIGYRVVHLDTDDVTFSGNNPHIPALAPPDNFVNIWMRKSILSRLGESSASTRPRRTPGSARESAPASIN